ncbi:MAG: dTDP-4-dehydrorhamnose 3,5-epimerase [Gammaproteobacteria bacterium]
MSVKVNLTAIDGVKIIEPSIYKDSRGYFYESFNQKSFSEALGTEVQFVQDNHSKSKRFVLRGLHYQINKPQAKLVRVIQGSVYDVTVDIRQSSKSFGKYVGIHVSAENNRQVWVPEGCAHGFLVTSPTAQVIYKTTDFYSPDNERCIRWDDPFLGIDWPLENGTMPLLSDRDGRGNLFSEVEFFTE